MRTEEIAKWFGIQYGTFRKNPNKYLEQLNNYCVYEKIYGGIIIKEIFVETYDKDLNIKIDKAYIKALNSHNNIISIIGTAEETNLSAYLLTKSRNFLFGKEARNKDENAKGLLGYREMLWVIKLKGANNYRKLTKEEEELFDNLIEQTYSKLDVKVIKAGALLLEYCAKQGLSAQEYKDISEKQGLNFFVSVINKFKKLTGFQLAPGTEHTLIQDFEEILSEKQLAYRNMLLEEIKKIKKEKNNVRERN